LQPKQTVYGITKQYKISEADLRKLNPELDSHLKIGDKITLPLDNIQKYADSSYTAVQSSTVSETKPIAKTETVTSEPAQGMYVVQTKDNYYKISKQFNLTQKQLFALNPGLETTGLKPGEAIKVSGNTPITVEDNSQNNSVSAHVTKPVAATPVQTYEPSATLYKVVTRCSVL
jgi:LysM repeat protein